MRNKYLLLIIFISLNSLMINESYAKSTIEDSQSDQSCIRCHTSSVQAWQNLVMPNQWLCQMKIQ